MQTLTRRGRIRELVTANPVVTQDELAAILHEEGVDVTQSTLSRDLAELGVIKRKGAYIFLDPPKGRLAQMGYLSAMKAGPNMIVVRTEVGAANRVAVFLDTADLPEVIGTIAGDDTIFLAVSGADSQTRILATLEGGL